MASNCWAYARFSRCQCKASHRFWPMTARPSIFWAEEMITMWICPVRVPSKTLAHPRIFFHRSVRNRKSSSLFFRSFLWVLWFFMVKDLHLPQRNSKKCCNGASKSAKSFFRSRLDMYQYSVLCTLVKSLQHIWPQKVPFTAIQVMNPGKEPVESVVSREIGTQQLRGPS